MFFFILGNHPELSKAEIQSKLNQLKINHETVAETDSFLILNFNGNVDVDFLIKQLAGTIKIGKVISEIKQATAEELIKFIPEKEKMIFGISPYGTNLNVDKLGLTIKKILKQNGHKARFVTSKESPLSSVIVQKELLNKGLELVILNSNNNLFIGETLCVQPFATFSEIDYGRPNRDSHSGMLPPKLAQMMINLSEMKSDGTLLDPFCGSGTILQQALFLGYKNILSADASEKAINDTKNNLDWFQNKIKINLTVPLYKTKAENLSSIIKKNSIDAIVTEPWLGPPLKGGERPTEMHSIIKQVDDLYSLTLISLEKVLKLSGTMIIVVPEFIIRGIQYQTTIENLIKNNFKITGHWTYARNDQMVIRHIYRLRKSQRSQ